MGDGSTWVDEVCVCAVDGGSHATGQVLYVLPIEHGGGEDLPTPPADPLIS